MGFSRQEYWSGLPFPSPGDLPDPGIKPASPALMGGVFTTDILILKLKVVLVLKTDAEVHCKNNKRCYGKVQTLPYGILSSGLQSSLVLEE